MKIINILDFSEYPGLRHCNVSDDSGEEFYHKILNGEFYNAFAKQETLEVNLDNTAGFAPSFLDEAFGNLVYDFHLENVEKYLKIISYQEPYLIDVIKNETFIEWEERRLKKERPKKTKKHSPWHMIKENNLTLSH